MSVRVAAIVLDYNGSELTISCARGLVASTYPQLDVLVVCNGSLPEHETRIRDALPEIEVLQTGRNLGYAGGMNEGIQWAIKRRADWFLLLNNDTEVEPEMVSRLVESLRERPRVGLACPLILFPDGDRVWFSRGWFDWKKGKPVTESGRASEFDGREPLSTGYANGCALMVSSQLVGSIGLLCSDYFLYYEDADFSERAARAGFERIVVPAARVKHLVSATSKRGSPDAIYYQVRGRLMFVSRHSTGLRRARLLSRQLLASTLRGLGTLLAGRRELGRARLAAVRDYLSGRLGHRPGLGTGVANR